MLSQLSSAGNGSEWPVNEGRALHLPLGGPGQVQKPGQASSLPGPASHSTAPIGTSGILQLRVRKKDTPWGPDLSCGLHPRLPMEFISEL